MSQASLRTDLLRNDFQSRVLNARYLLESAHPGGLGLANSQAIRGLTFVLLFAAYERLIHDLCRTILETCRDQIPESAILKPEYRFLGFHSTLKGIRDKPTTSHWKAATLENVQSFFECGSKEIDVSAFPDDGSFMKKSQVLFLCSRLAIPDPMPVLKERADLIDMIVGHRNAIAHGAKIPEEIGRTFTFKEVDTTVTEWENAWCDFLDFVEATVSAPNFYVV